MAAGAIVGIIATIAAIEGVMTVLEHTIGDPETDVQQALAALTAKNQRRAFALEAGEVLGEEDIQQQFSQFNFLPRRALTEAALSESAPGSVRAGLEPDTSLLDFVSSRIGSSPDAMRAMSAPRRVGDMSGVFRSAGKTPPG